MSGCNKIVTINHLYMLEEMRLKTYEISLYIIVCLTTRSNLAVWSYSPVCIKNNGIFYFPLLELGAPPLTSSPSEGHNTSPTDMRLLSSE